MSGSQFGVRIATSKSGNAYIAGLYGKDGVAQKLKAMGMERNHFQKLVKKAAIIVASRATKLAPVDSGKLAMSIRGFAGKKVTPNNAPARYLYGGLVIAQPKSETGANSYGKSVSFGRYYKRSGLFLRTAAKVLGDSRGVRQTAIRNEGNPYIKNAREQTRANVVRMWNFEIGRWIEDNGLEATGFWK